MKPEPTMQATPAKKACWLILTGNVPHLAFLLALALHTISASAAYQPMAITAGDYNLTAEGTNIPAYCLDERLKSPSSDARFVSILQGGEHLYVILAKGERMSFEQATKQGLIKITGTHSHTNLHVSANRSNFPLRLVVERPVALTSEPWLQSSEEYKLSPEYLNKALQLVSAKPSAGGVASSGQPRPQDRVWSAQRDAETGLYPTDKTLFDSRFGRAGRAAVADANSNSPVVSRFVSVLSNDYFLKLSAVFKQQWWTLAPREDRLSPLDKDRHEVLSAKIGKRLAGILNARQLDDTAFLAQTVDNRWLFVTKTNQVQLDETINSGTNLEVVWDWMRSEGNHELNLIMVSDKPAWYRAQHRESDLSSMKLAQLIRGDAASRQTNAARFRIFEAGDPEKGVENLLAYPRVQSGTNVAVYYDPSLHGMPVLKDTAAAAPFHKAGIILVTTNVLEVCADHLSNVVVVPAHKDSNYRNFVSDLATKGCLTNKVVVLLSCADTELGADSAFGSFLIRHGGARVIIRMNRKIDNMREALPILRGLQNMPVTPQQPSQLMSDVLEKLIPKLKPNNKEDPLHCIIQLSRMNPRTNTTHG